MRIIVAPDSFKGSLTALEAACAMERGILAVFPDSEVFKVPVADGGEGTVAALVAATGGQLEQEQVTGPLGSQLTACWGILGDGQTAVVEMAAASGLPLVPENLRDPRLTTSYGTGQLIKAALDRGLQRIIIGIGGSATNDGGSGMACALGARFFDVRGADLPPGGAALRRLAAIDIGGLDRRLESAVITVACDVDNPLYGPNGATVVYGPQKGATPGVVAELDDALKVYAAFAQAATGRDVANLPGAGAAGGLGAGLMFFSQAKLLPGVEIILEAVGFSALVKQADLVITGEGRTDFQTVHGKVPLGVTKAAKRCGVPVICIAGGLGDGHKAIYDYGVDGLMSIVEQPMTLAECMERGAELVEGATIRAMRLVKVGGEMHPGFIGE